ncbi:MAG: response regulator [Proteobacteria bacterium]|nr:response regulator [Pseudomonadota bacterium]
MSELNNLIKNMPGFKILIVDDKANMRRTMRNMLRLLGFNSFREADDGDNALQKLRSEKFDFVICDWNMPRMNGLEVLRSVRQDDRFKDIPFMMVTAEVEESTVAESIEADVDGYVIKPLLPTTLETKMIEILTRKLTPSPLETHLQVAEVLLKARSIVAVHQELDKAAQISPRSPKVFFFRGLAFEAQGDLDNAEKAFAAARQFGPKFIRAHEKLAEILEKQGRQSEMVEILKEVVRVSPKNAERQTKLGQALLADGRIQEAKKAFNFAVQLEPDNYERKTAIGEAYLAHGLAQDAENAFKSSIETNPDDVYVYNRLGIAFRRQKKFEEAIQYYLKALSIDPEEENLLYNLARAYLGAQKTEPAVGALKKAIKIEPEFKEARSLLAKIQSR